MHHEFRQWANELKNKVKRCFIWQVITAIGKHPHFFWQMRMLTGSLASAYSGYGDLQQVLLQLFPAIFSEYFIGYIGNNYYFFQNLT